MRTRPSNAAALRNTTIVNDSQGDTPAIQTPRVWRVRLGWLLAFVAVLHAPSLFNDFIIDDYVYLDTVHDMTWADVPDVVASATMDEHASGVWWTPQGVLPFYRPLGVLTFAVEYVVWGMRPFGYHLTNLVLHLLCTFLTWRLACRLFGGWIPLAAATIFAIHPVHSEAVLWISGRFDLLVCACMLGSVLSYLNWQREDGGRWWWGALSVFWFVAGLGCKETALILPAVLFLAECVRWRGRGAAYRFASLAVGAFAFGAVSLLYLATRFALFGGLGTLPPPYGVDFSTPAVVWEILRNASFYLLDFVLFVQVDALYLAEFWTNHVWFLLLCTSMALALVWMGWRVARGTLGFRLGLLWVVCFVAPAMLTMPGERNVYLASVGVALVGAGVVDALVRRYRPGGVGAVRLRRSAAALLAICVVMVGVEHVLMWRVATTSENVYKSLLAILPDPPPDTRIYVVNQCPINAVGFTQAVRLIYGRDDVLACNLTLSPRLEETGSNDIVYQLGPSSIRVVRENGRFFESFIERFLMFSGPVEDMGQSARRMDLELLTVPASVDALDEFEFKLPYELGDERLQLLTWNNSHVRTLADLIWLADWPLLEPCPLQPSPSAVARK